MTTTAAKSDLEYKVDLVNRVNQAANEYQDAILERASKYVGCKILKVDGSLLKSVKDDLSSVPVPDGVSIWFDASHCSLWVEIKGHENGERYTIYHKGAILIGYVTNQELAELKPDPCGYRTDYTADEVLKARKRIDDLEQKIRAEKSITCYFERI